MPKASELEITRNTSFLLKSPPGFGKTIAACSAAVFGPVFLAYFDKKAPTEVLTFYKKHRPELLENIEWESYGSSNAHEYLNKLIGFLKDCRYSAIVTDSVTSLTSAAVNWSLSFRDVKGGAKMDKLNKEAPQMIPDWDEYKVETSLVTQALDICKKLDVMNIWTAHPLPQLKLSGSGTNVTSVSTTQTLVSYGNKVGAMIPAAFSEQYHFGRQGGKRVVFTDAIGDDFAKTSLPLPKMLDIEDKLFFEVWRDAVNKGLESLEGGKDVVNPFSSNEGSKKWKI